LPALAHQHPGICLNAVPDLGTLTDEVAKLFTSRHDEVCLSGSIPCSRDLLPRNTIILHSTTQDKQSLPVKRNAQRIPDPVVSALLAGKSRRSHGHYAVTTSLSKPANERRKASRGRKWNRDRASVELDTASSHGMWACRVTGVVNEISQAVRLAETAGHVSDCDSAARQVDMAIPTASASQVTLLNRCW